MQGTRYCFIAIATLTLVLTGCAETHVDFRPYSAAAGDYRPLMSYAIVAYEGDIPTLANAGGQIVGTLDVGGNGYADSNDVRSRAMTEAARAGGTHILIAGEGSSTSWAQLTPDRATTTVSGSTATTTFTPGAQIPVTRDHGTFVVVRVPPDRWLDLPIGLRPEPGVHFEGDYPRRRHEFEDSEPTEAREPSVHVSPPAVPSREAGWFCTSNGDGTLGTCVRSEADCKAAYEGLTSADPSSTPCAAASAATCFSSYGPTTQPQTSCFPTIQACRARRALALSGGEKIGRECGLSQ